MDKPARELKIWNHYLGTRGSVCRSAVILFNEKMEIISFVLNFTADIYFFSWHLTERAEIKKTRRHNELLLCRNDVWEILYKIYIFPVNLIFQNLWFLSSFLFLIVKLKFYGHHHDLDNGYWVSMSQMTTDVVITIRSFSHSWLITRIVPKATW
jgi:hypothetical protein